MSTDEGWEERMAARARERRRATAAREVATDHPFASWLEPGEEDISPLVLAARVLGLSYGDPGPVLPPEYCRTCWGERFVWYGNTWGLQHQNPRDLFGCGCTCHKDDVLLAQPGAA